MTQLTLSDINIAWLAGLLEGEGSFGLDRRPQKRYNHSTAPPGAYIKIAMTDEDIICRVAMLLNKNYFSPSRLTKTGKNVYICHIGDRTTLIYLLPKLLPYMGKRRQKIIQECLVELEKGKSWNSKRTQTVENKNGE
jgi:hypothetical protein